MPVRPGPVFSDEGLNPGPSSWTVIRTCPGEELGTDPALHVCAHVLEGVGHRLLDDAVRRPWQVGVDRAAYAHDLDVHVQPVVLHGLDAPLDVLERLHRGGVGRHGHALAFAGNPLADRALPQRLRLAGTLLQRLDVAAPGPVRGTECPGESHCKAGSGMNATKALQSIAAGESSQARNMTMASPIAETTSGATVWSPSPTTV